MSSPPAAQATRRTLVEGSDGIGLSVLERNIDGPEAPMLLVHGLASNAHLWDGVAERVATAGHPVVAVDQRGHGRSDKPGHGYDFVTLTDDLLFVLDRYGWGAGAGQSPLAAGQSWGANVVLELAARHPDAVGAIALVDGGTGDLADAFADWPTCEVALAPPPLAGLAAADFESFLRAAHSDWPEEGIAATLENMEHLTNGTIRPWLSRADHMAILRLLWEHRPSTRFAGISTPALIIPAEDPSNQRWMAGKRESVERAAGGLGRSVVHWIPGDHDLHAQHPDLVAALLDAAARPGFFE